MYAQSLGQIHETFWKAFGRYMVPVPSASGERVNWVNYKTGVKSVRFSLGLHDQGAEIAIVVNDPELFAHSIAPLRHLFASMVGEDWTWTAVRIAARLEGKDVRHQEDWPDLISFFKQRLIALDAFWEEVKEGLW